MERKEKYLILAGMIVWVSRCSQAGGEEADFIEPGFVLLIEDGAVAVVYAVGPPGFVGIDKDRFRFPGAIAFYSFLGDARCVEGEGLGGQVEQPEGGGGGQEERAVVEAHEVVAVVGGQGMAVEFVQLGDCFRQGGCVRGRVGLRPGELPADDLLSTGAP